MLFGGEQLNMEKLFVGSMYSFLFIVEYMTNKFLLFEYGPILCNVSNTLSRGCKCYVECCLNTKILSKPMVRMSIRYSHNTLPIIFMNSTKALVTINDIHNHANNPRCILKVLLHVSSIILLI